MGDELRGENLVHLNVRFSTETELKKIQDFLYEKSGQGVSFTGLVEAMVNEVTIVTAVHNIKSNKGSKTAGVAGKNLCNRPAGKRYTLSWLCGKGRTKTENS